MKKVTYRMYCPYFSFNNYKNGNFSHSNKYKYFPFGLRLCILKYLGDNYYWYDFRLWVYYGKDGDVCHLDIVWPTKLRELVK